ncbi:MAG TPA: hypothetical protein VMR23_09025 [Candidatus Limnocylindria bacterium]|nr:hypothetical protein [Candidatus Limnocylindria bacterium]
MMMRTLIVLRAAVVGLAVAVAASALPATVHAQAPAPGWDRHVGEGPFSLRPPARGIYFILGGHAGFAESTRLDDDGDCTDALAFFLGWENARPSDSLGTVAAGSARRLQSVRHGRRGRGGQRDGRCG